MVLQRKLALLQSDADLIEKILAAGGFRDADGDWNTLSEVAVSNKQSELSRIKQFIQQTQRRIAEGR